MPADRARNRVAPDGVQPRARAPQKPARRTRAELRLGLLPDLLGYHLRLAQRAVFEDFAASIGEADITPGLFGMLVIIEANPGLMQSELAAAAQLDRSSIVPVVDKLEARGLVSRRASSADRRVNGLWLTPECSVLLRTLKRRVLGHEQRIMQPLTQAERKQLFELLARLGTRDS